AVMANTAVQGTIVDEAGGGVADLQVVAFDVEVLTRPDVLGFAMTRQGDGFFRIEYPGLAYGIELRPDLMVRVFSPIGGRLYESAVSEQVAADPFVLAPIVLNAAERTGLAATLRTGAATMSSGGNLVAFDIDNEAAFRRLTDFVNASMTSVECSQLLVQV